jgi:hypothetical protein
MSHEDKTFDMRKSVMRLIILGIALATIPALNGLLSAAEAQKLDGNASFITYNNTAYGISINYPSNWQLDQTANEYLLAILQNLSSYSQGENDNQNNAFKSKVSEVLDVFGLESVSDILGLSPDKRAEVLQLISQKANEGTFQTIVAITSPEDEFGTTIANMNIVAEKIPTESSISLKDYTNANIEGLKILFQNVTIVQPPKEITINGKPAMTMIYTAKLPEVPVTIKALVVLATKGNTGYVMTFGAIPETYSTYEPIFEKMLQSFRISN